MFFIDEGKKYCAPDGGKGIYAQMFEKLYVELMDLPKYAPLKGRFTADAECVHNGYFSQIRCGKAHFKAINTGAELYAPINDWKSFKVKNIKVNIPAVL